LRTIGFAYKDL